MILSKTQEAVEAYKKLMDVLIPSWKEDPNCKDTPQRVIKSLTKELWRGLYEEEPKVTVFENVDKYTGIVFDGNIEVSSICSHHHLPFTGVAHVAYIPDEYIIGLSKLNRVVDYFSRRPQVQENLTTQIHNYLSKIIFPQNNGSIAVVIEANHTCCSLRGVRHDSIMKTSKLSGSFLNEPDCRAEFYQFISDLKR